MLYVVKYSGPFGYIKPWTAVRDNETYSQQFLTPSIVEGIEKKLFPESLSSRGKILKIKRHRLNYAGIDLQQERTQPKGKPKVKRTKDFIQNESLGILNRGVMLEPNLYLAFAEEEDARRAYTQHICLCRNEDILLPEELLIFRTEEEFDQIDGFELFFCGSDEGFQVGYNRFDSGKPMYGIIKIFGNPIRLSEYVNPYTQASNRTTG